MIIAVDAMGSDNAPGVEIEGAILAGQSYDAELLLVGKPEVIEAELAKHPAAKRLSHRIIPASEVAQMHEHPVDILRRKKQSSISVATRLIRSGDADAVVSAGNTGAAIAVARAYLKKLKHVNRPALATIFPNRDDATLVLDVGANVDSGARDLVEFAVMGQIYSECILKKKFPRVGLLNNGEEATKGNRVVQETYRLLRQHHSGFVGNVEGRDIFNGSVDVVVCDGFVGNIVLKSAEGIAEMMISALRSELTRSTSLKLGALFVQKALRRLKKRIDYSEYGGATLLGVNGTCIIGHGGSSPLAVKNAIRVAIESVEQRVNQQIEQRLAESKW